MVEMGSRLIQRVGVYRFFKHYPERESEDNAIQYTPKGGITVSAMPDGRDVKLMVADTGIGIPEEQQEEIFERFFRADPSRNRGAGQVGLGLSIAKWIVEAHGGHISVQSSPGEGSTFTVKLPILRA